MQRITLIAGLLVILFAATAAASPYYHVTVDTQDKYERAQLSALGMSIDGVDLKSGKSHLVADLDQIRKIEKAGYAVTFQKVDSPKSMAGYHLEEEVTAFLENLESTYPDVAGMFVLGTTIEGREIQALKISDNVTTNEGEPGFFLVARHHAREPLTTELALETAKRLLENYESDPWTQYLIDEHEIYIIPRLNEDGASYDEDQGYAYWRKNRQSNVGFPQCPGVDLNRNYGYEWGHDSGSSSYPCDEVYRGTAAFSEPCSLAVRDFINGHSNITMLITLHTYGELILYPWGYTYDPVSDSLDLEIFQETADVYAGYNGYSPGPGSGLYPTSGDTVDWAYGEKGIYAFTFELSPDGWPYFYPEDNIFTKVFNDNVPIMEMTTAFSKNPEMVLSCDLWQFGLESDETTVTIDWSPIIEQYGSGYDVLRSETETGVYEAVNGAEIELGLNSYEFIDTPPLPVGKPQVYFFYKVRYNSTTGRDQEFGPLTASFTIPDDDDDDNDDNDTVDDDDDNDTVDDDDDDTADDDDNDDETADDDSADDDDSGDDDADSGACCG